MTSDRPQSSFTLRPLEKADLTVITRWFRNLTDLATFDRTCRIPLNLASTESDWESALGSSRSNERCWFAIDTSGEDMVGVIGLDAISAVNRDAVIALFIDEAVRRQGVGIRASALVLDVAFRHLGLNRVTSYFRDDNSSSREVLDHLGFTIEGQMRNAWFADDNFFDIMVVGILRGEWNARREALARDLDPVTTVTFGETASSDWTWPPRNTGVI